MTTPDDVRRLAALARIRVDEGALDAFAREFGAILAYVGQLEKLSLTSGRAEKHMLRNVLRQDGEPHAARAHTETLAEQFPAREGDALVVKQIITHE